MVQALIVSVLSLLLSSDAFAPSPSSAFLSRVASPSSSSSSSLKVNGRGNDNNFNNNILVISPPGGVGEMAAIESAKLGGNVKWFIVAPPSAASTSTKTTAGSVSISAETMSYIHNSGGFIDFASACTTDLLQSSEGSNNSNEALNAIGSWCNNPSCIIATYDGINIAIAKSVSSSGSVGGPAGEGIVMGEMIESMKSGIRLAAREASRNSRSNIRSIAILATGEEQETAEEAEAGGGVSGMVENLGSMIANLVGKSTNSNDMPRTLKQAISTSSSASSGTTATTVIRHGELFGSPDSSPDSSPFMGGPRRDPVVRDMYAMRSVRIDPLFTGGGGSGSGEGGMGYRSNRLTVAEATARLGLGRITSTTFVNPAKMMEISVSSFPGTDGPSNEEWENEFRRVISEITTSSTSQSSSVVTTLFRAEFASVPSSKRLAAWLAEKWAPAVLRSYDIAGIRVGSRPVYANVIPDNSTDDDGSVTVVEIVWQDLVNFNPVTSGRMYVTVSSTGISATRGPGSASSGFGAVALVPLAGEEILVKRLADAASQAVEKGLAVKAISTKKTEEVVVEAVLAPLATTIFTPPDDRVVPSTSSDKSGPRNTGARRSSERTRGSKTTPSSVKYDGE